MKAVFIHQDSLLRDSHIDAATTVSTWRLMPATIEAVRLLGNPETLIVLYCSPGAADDQDADPHRPPESLTHVARQIAAGGGRVDSLVSCADPVIDGNTPGVYHGLIWATTARYGLRPEQCYLIGDAPPDVATAAASGVRPLVILGERHIDEVFGRSEIERDFPLTADLATAVRYIEVEEEIARQIGEPRSESIPVPGDMLRPANAGQLPVVTAVSDLARSLEEKTGKSRVQRRDIARWLFLFSVGALGLSLGVAYLLTDLYRAQPFPEFVYYLTLQFIPRSARGLLFILIGTAIVALAVRSMVRGAVWREWFNGKRYTP